MDNYLPDPRDSIMFTNMFAGETDGWGNVVQVRLYYEIFKIEADLWILDLTKLNIKLKNCRDRSPTGRRLKDEARFCGEFAFFKRDKMKKFRRLKV